MFGQHPGLLKPFEAFANCCKKLPNLSAIKPFQATIFRLALRAGPTEGLARLAHSHFGLRDARDSLHNLGKAAPEMLVFSKHVTQIDMLTKAADTSTVHCSCSRVYGAAAATTAPLDGHAQNIEIKITDNNGNNSKQCWLLVSRKCGDEEIASVAVLVSDTSVADQQLPPCTGKLCQTLPCSVSTSGLKMHFNAKFQMAADKARLYDDIGHFAQVSPT